MNGITQAVEKAGSKRKLAEILHVSTQAVHEWVNKGYAPPARAIEIERLFEIPRTSLVKAELAELIEPTF